MASSKLFTSESVSEGHPDKMADQISDAVLDAILAVDPTAKVAAETLVKTGFVVLAGEIDIATEAKPVFFELEELVRQVILDIGYNDSAIGFDGARCGILNALGPQSSDIRQGVDRDSERGQGAGDQGMMFGYATDEVPGVLMPAPISFAHRLVRRQAEVRKSGELPWLRPDAKSQVTMVYDGDRPVGIDAVVLSTQHAPGVDNRTIHAGVMDTIIKPVLDPTGWLSERTRFHINPTGCFEIGGPQGDCGLTGRKIIVDTYGGMARHGGGAFSGKDPSKVDRSAAYAGRYVAKNIVAAGLARRCEVQISYAIGVAEPTSISVDTFGTASIPEDRLVPLIREVFDLTPYGICEMLDLRRPIYRPTAAYGHFGRDDIDLSWERTDRAEALRGAAAA